MITAWRWIESDTSRCRRGWRSDPRTRTTPITSSWAFGIPWEVCRSTGRCLFGLRSRNWSTTRSIRRISSNRRRAAASTIRRPRRARMWSRREPETAATALSAATSSATCRIRRRCYRIARPRAPTTTHSSADKNSSRFNSLIET